MPLLVARKRAGSRNRSRLPRRPFAPEVDASLEVRTLIDGNSRRKQVPDDLASFANLDFFTGGNLAADRPEDDYLAGMDFGLHLAFQTNREGLVLQADASFEPPLNRDIFVSPQLSLSHCELAEDRRSLTECGRS